jgi:hypothetical protein
MMILLNNNPVLNYMQGELIARIGGDKYSRVFFDRLNPIYQDLFYIMMGIYRSLLATSRRFPERSILSSNR